MKTPMKTLLSIATLALAACSSGPRAPDWQVNAKDALDDAVQSALVGDARGENAAFDRARRELARTGRPDLLARAELMRCAAHVASLQFGPCAGFEALRADAADDERLYADHLAAKVLSKAQIERLPTTQQRAAAALAGGDASAASLQEIADPLARLIAIAVLFEAGKASPQLIALAADTASQQGWRRPLLAWLGVQAELAERAGRAQEAQRLRRRMDVVGG
jgi:hypothetical protein